MIIQFINLLVQNLNEIGYIFALSMQFVASCLLFRNIFKGRNVIIKDFFNNVSTTTNLEDKPEYNKNDFKEKFLEAYSNSWALFLFICGFILRIFVSKGDLSFWQIVLYVIVLSILLIKIVFKYFVDAKASKNVEKHVTYEELEELGIKMHKISKLENEENVHSSDSKINDSSNKNDLYLMKLNHALTLYKSIEYSDEKQIKNVNLYRKIKFYAKQIFKAFKESLICLSITFTVYGIVILIFMLAKDPKLETIISVCIFALVLRMFDISFDKVDEGVHRVSKVDKELYEIALDIYDQLCLDQDDQDKRKLKDYMERRFLNQK